MKKNQYILPEEPESFYKELEHTNLMIADLRQQITELKNQRILTYATPKKDMRLVRLEILWHEARVKGSLDYKDIMILLNLNHRQTAYRLMTQAEDQYPKDLIVMRSIQSKKLRLIWKGEL